MGIEDFVGKLQMPHANSYLLEAIAEKFKREIIDQLTSMLEPHIEDVVDQVLKDLAVEAVISPDENFRQEIIFRFQRDLS